MYEFSLTHSSHSHTHTLAHSLLQYSIFKMLDTFPKSPVLYSFMCLISPVYKIYYILNILKIVVSSLPKWTLHIGRLDISALLFLFYCDDPHHLPTNALLRYFLEYTSDNRFFFNLKSSRFF